MYATLVIYNYRYTAENKNQNNPNIGGDKTKCMF